MQTDDTFSVLLAIGIGIVGLLLYAVATAGMVALERSSEGRLRDICGKKQAKLNRAIKHFEHPQRFLSTTSFLRIISSFTPASAMCLFISPFIKSLLSDWGIGAQLISYGLTLTALSLIWLFFGSMLPRKITANAPEKSFLRLMGIINIFAILLRPATAALTLFSNLIVKALGKDPHLEDQPVTEEQVMRLVDESEEDGEISGLEADMIENIFDFNDTAVSEIMTHRIDVTAVNDKSTIPQIVNIAVNHGYSRIPVYHKTIDTIVGVVYVKDLLNLIGKPISKNIGIKHIMRKPYLVPESKAINKLFAEMTEQRIHFAVLIDEYGGTAGIVTMEDILESIVGNIQDEYDNEAEDVFRLSENMFTVDGSKPVDEVADLLDHELPEGDYDTIAGMVVELLGNLPEENEYPSVAVDNIEFHVIEFEDNRIEKILVEKHPVTEKE